MRLSPVGVRLWLSMALLIIGCVFGAGAPCLAGPPYVTDDPEPAELGHWEVYAFATGTRVPGEISGSGGLDINFGAFRDVQLTAVLPLDFDRDDRMHGGFGDVELGVKYRFIHQSVGGFTPDVAIFPSIVLPTGSDRLGGGHAGLLLPVWLQKDAGPWTWFGGAGYTLNTGAGRQNTWLVGSAVTRKISEQLELGVEVFRATAEVRAEKAATGLGFGFTYDLGKGHALVGSAGPQWRDQKTEANFYLGLEFQR